MYQKFLLFCLLMAVSQHARTADLFYGIALLNQEVDISVSSTGNTLTTTEDGTGFGIFADKYYRGTYRFSGMLSYVDYTDFYITSATASADYLIPINATFTFFAGLTAGLTGQVYSDSSFGDMAASYLAGAQIGGIMLAGDHLMLELGFRQRTTDLETDLTDISAVATIDELSETYISVYLLF